MKFLSLKTIWLASIFFLHAPFAFGKTEFQELPRTEPFFTYESYTRENYLSWRLEIFPDGAALFTGIREVKAIGTKELQGEALKAQNLYDAIRNSEFVNLPNVVFTLGSSLSGRISHRLLLVTPDTTKSVTFRGDADAPPLSPILKAMREAYSLDSLLCPWIYTRIGHPSEGMEKCSGKRVSPKELEAIRDQERLHGHQ